jgi:hypothetical protein
MTKNRDHVTGTNPKMDGSILKKSILPWEIFGCAQRRKEAKEDGFDGIQATWLSVVCEQHRALAMATLSYAESDGGFSWKRLMGHGGWKPPPRSIFGLFQQQLQDLPCGVRDDGVRSGALTKR